MIVTKKKGKIIQVKLDHDLIEDVLKEYILETACNDKEREEFQELKMLYEEYPFCLIFEKV